ncbi:hypothetical protein [Bradyrhizobium sp. 150]|uniref:hypothetical protein n=1 Tax=Bradyrhizobium sp. 150 TaxID=2782625 RepID=UPI001FF773E5|nr:hypothetical protein [Bradyrhizobium sp. 150]MCK1670330.1 hypothetical protein [Bradyrhizobium sp. 150]
MKSKITTVPVARPGDIYLVSCPGYWGKGETIPLAIKAMPYGLDEKSWILYSVEPQTVIDDSGFFRHAVGHAPTEIACCDKLKKRMSAK